MKIFVAGASGFVGRALVETLIHRGYEVIALSRNAERSKAKLPGSCVVIEGDASRDLDWSSSLEGCDGLINLIGETVIQRWSGAKKRRMEESRIRSTENFSTVIGRLANPPKFWINASAIGHYEPSVEEVYDESSIAGNGYLSQLCTRWEAAANVSDSTRLIFLRIGLVLHPDGGILGNMLPPFRVGLGGRLGEGMQWMSWIHRSDLVDLILYIMAKEEIAGACNATAPKPVTNREFTRVLAKKLSRPALFPVPEFALQVIYGEASSAITASHHVLPKKALDIGFSFRFATLEDALTDLL